MDNNEFNELPEATTAQKVIYTLLSIFSVLCISYGFQKICIKIADYIIDRIYDKKRKQISEETEVETVEK